MSGSALEGPLACVVLAHGDPQHVHRLVAALDPFPVFLHVDAATPGDVHREIVTGLPDRVRLLPRLRTGWASWSLVEAELAGYRAALTLPGVTHVALLTGSDYPLASTAAMSAFLLRHRGTSVASQHTLPYAPWGVGGGVLRLRLRYWARGKRMVVLPVPRRIPAGLVATGGSQLKVLAREHAAAVVGVVARRPDLVRFFRRTWVPDETFVLTVLNSPSLVVGYAAEHLPASLWHIGWDPQQRRKSPPWVTSADLPVLRESAAGRWGSPPAFFARKFSGAVDAAVLDVVDAELRSPRVGQVVP